MFPLKMVISTSMLLEQHQHQDFQQLFEMQLVINLNHHTDILDIDQQLELQLNHVDHLLEFFDYIMNYDLDFHLVCVDQIELHS